MANNIAKDGFLQCKRAPPAPRKAVFRNAGGIILRNRKLTNKPNQAN